MLSSIYPWQQPQWQQLLTSKKENRVPHALMLLGNPGLGQRHFAITWSKHLLCVDPDACCERCHSCHLMDTQSHPDFLLVEPEHVGGMIKIDQIRDLIQFANETALKGNNRVIIIHPATAMNVASANALLKTLEEPASNTFMILINDQPGKLPATVLSRCQKLKFHPPIKEEALTWLQKETMLEDKALLSLTLRLSENAPLQAKDSLQNGFLSLRQVFYKDLIALGRGELDPLQLASRYQDEDPNRLLNLLMMWIHDVIRFQMTQNQAELIHSDFEGALVELANRLPTAKALNYYEYLKKTYSYLLSNLNLNRQLLLEDLFIRFPDQGSHPD